MEATLTGRPAEDDPFGWRVPELPPGRTEALGRAVGAWTAEGRRVVITSDQASRLSEILAEAGHPVAVVPGIAEAPPAGAVALVERSLNAGFTGGPDGLVILTDRELFGTVRVRRPKALRRVVPRDILDRLNPGDLVVHVDHGVARYERMLRRGDAGEERDYLELAFAGRRADLRPGRADRADHALRRRRAPGALPPGRGRVGADEGARPQGGRRPRRRAPRALRRPRDGRGVRVRRGHARGRPSWRRRSRTRRPTTSSAPPPR